MHFCFFASCPRGIEPLLSEELLLFGANDIKISGSGVSFTGDMKLAYHICLWSRLANHLFLKLNSAACSNKNNLYNFIFEIDWTKHITKISKLRIDCNGLVHGINNTRYAVYLVKDAIVDKIKLLSNWRPEINTENPNIRIYIHIHKNIATVYLNLSGQSLHQRSYRIQGGIAPIKENLAAALLIRSQWIEKAKKNMPLIDPMCGSGTFLIEAAMMAADIAPGLLRRNYGFEHWPGHIPKLWEKQISEANEKKQLGLNKKIPPIIGFEGVSAMVKKANANISNIGLASFISIQQQELQQFKLPESLNKGLIICNPPYGERLGDKKNLQYLYQHLGEKLKQECPGWQAGILSGNQDLIQYLAMGFNKKYALFNGKIPCHFYYYHVREQSHHSSIKKAIPPNHSILNDDLFDQSTTMLINRINKNQRFLKKWIHKNKLQCYRLYHADIPEFSFIVDVYNDWLHIQEYQAPKTISEDIARKRFQKAVHAISITLNFKKSNIVLKQRKKQKGSLQYKKIKQNNHMIEIREQNCRFLINLHDYLDTGIFLDHRLIRLRIQKEAAGKKFLNLFCYTGTATVHAAMGGSPRSTSVDLSKTYLDWAKKNLALNGFSEARHQFEQHDCIQWLEKNNQLFDIIFVDPPTFSNSKKLNNDFDVQHDHLKLIQLAMQSLNKNGVLYFSNNFRRFKIDNCLFQSFKVKEITQQTIDKDFINRKPVHQCWKFEH